MPEIERPLKVFLFHAPSDKIAVRDLYLRLLGEGVDAWLVKDKLLPGQDWTDEIHKAVGEADAVIICLSEGFNQGEFRRKRARAAFDAVVEQLDDELFLICARLEDCALPEPLGKCQSVDLFETGGHEMLIHALQAHAEQIGATLEIKESALPQATVTRVEGEQPVPEEKPVETVQGIIELVEGSGILIEGSAVRQYKPERTILLTLLGFAVISMMALFGPAWIEESTPVTVTPTLKPTRTAAPPKEVTPDLSFQFRPIPTLVSQGKVSHLVFLIDTSGSMGGQRSRVVKSTVSEFIARLGDDYLISVIEFDTNVELRMDSTRDRAAAFHAIRAITIKAAEDGSCLFDAMSAGFQQASPTTISEGTASIIILLTDVAVGDNVGQGCGSRVEFEFDALLWEPTVPPLFTIYLGDHFAQNQGIAWTPGENAIRLADDEEDIEHTLLLISQAAGLDLSTEMALPARITDTRRVSMVFVPSGEFIMGDKTVHLDSFWIDKTEVTNGMYARCVQAGACSEPRSSRSNTHDLYYGTTEFENYPVIYVSWEDARNYCAWTAGRLPTEAEWEKAARGTDGRQFPWGDADPSGVVGLVNYYGQDTIAVGSYPNGAGPYGALDMSGNVSEWVADWFSMDSYNSPPYRNPLGPEIGEYRVWRGGSWANTSVDSIRAYSRTGNLPTDSSGGIGFRCARDASP